MGGRRDVFEGLASAKSETLLLIPTLALASNSSLVMLIPLPVHIQGRTEGVCGKQL